MRPKFALITHPYDLAHARRILLHYEPGAKLPRDKLLTRILEWTPAFKIAEWHGITSAAGAVADGYNVACPIMPEMPSLGPRAIFEKVRGACQLAGELGAGIAALGGFTSIYGENEHCSAAADLDIAVTTGNSLTAAMALQGLTRAAALLGIDLGRVPVAIIGATGDIGSACARALAGQVGRLHLTARGLGRLEALAESLDGADPGHVWVTTDNHEALREAQAVLCVASASVPILEPDDIRPGAVVCDVGYPKNVARRTRSRDDVFVFDGGLVALPEPLDFGFDNGLPNPSVLYGCFAEGMVLALEGRLESFSLGKGHISAEQIAEISAMATRHGFELAPFYSGGRLVPDDELVALRERLTVRL